MIFENRGESGRNKLADTLIVLGEVSLESENFEAAVNDIKKGLEILDNLPDKNERVLAETYYKLGMALSTNSQMDEAIDSFGKSLELLKGRIKHLEEKGEDKEEVEQMKGLVPELEEKIADMKSFKEEVSHFSKTKKYIKTYNLIFLGFKNVDSRFVRRCRTAE